MINFKQFPMFSVGAFSVMLEDINIEEIEIILNKIKYQKIETNLFNNKNNFCSTSKDINIFKTHKKLNRLKLEILKAVSIYNEKIMGYKKTKFEITSSWSTKTNTDESSLVHCHSNNMYSAVYYNKVNNNMGKLHFHNFATSSYELEIDKYTEYNSKSYLITPENMTLIIFPSHLYHSILKNNIDNKEIRYSIACNIHPVGDYGHGDSTIKELNFNK
jgi:uncharacterized protein (TIGR02466 family)